MLDRALELEASLSEATVKCDITLHSVQGKLSLYAFNLIFVCKSLLLRVLPKSHQRNKTNLRFEHIRYQLHLHIFYIIKHQSCR